MTTTLLKASACVLSYERQAPLRLAYEGKCLAIINIFRVHIVHKEALFGHCLPFCARLAMIGIGVNGQASAGQEFAPDLDVFGVHQFD